MLLSNVKDNFSETVQANNLMKHKREASLVLHVINVFSYHTRMGSGLHLYSFKYLSNVQTQLSLKRKIYMSRSYHVATLIGLFKIQLYYFAVLYLLGLYLDTHYATCEI